MKTSLDQLPKPLPPEKRAELEKVVEIIQHRFELNKDDPRFGLEMIILFGSYARGTWVEETVVKNGITHEYNSDFDILVVTHKHVSDDDWLDLCIEEKLETRRRSFKTEVNIIHHPMPFLKRRLKENHYFFTDVIKEGVFLYDTGQNKLPQPGTISTLERADLAQDDLEYWMKEGDGFFRHYGYAVKDEDYKKAAFMLHQSTQSYYTAMLLVFIGYKPRGHNIKHFRGQVNSIDERFKAVFPNTTKQTKKWFTLLVRAYIDARYKKNYTITLEELEYLAGRVQVLRECAWEIAPEEIDRLRGTTKSTL